MTNYQEVNFKRIPTVDFPEDRDFSVESVDEELVDPAAYSGGRIVSDSAYYAQGIKGSIDLCPMRRGAADRLLKAASLLPEGYTFQIFDAWRPYEVQYSLYYNYFGALADSGKYDDYLVKELHKVTRTFVSFPRKGEAVSYVHSSGGAVDLTIVDENGRELPMGSGFDEFTDRSNTDYYETHEIDEEVRRNRRMLYHVMTESGFVNLPSEWWHFDYGDKFWAYYTGNSVLYESLYGLPQYLKEKVRVHG